MSAEPRELLCQLCWEDYPVWSADNDLWNEVMRGGNRANADEYDFLCPLCFMLLAERRGAADSFFVSRADEITRLRTENERLENELIEWQEHADKKRVRVEELEGALKRIAALDYTHAATNLAATDAHHIARRAITSQEEE